MTARLIGVPALAFGILSVSACEIRQGGDLSSVHSQLSRAADDLKEGVTITYEFHYSGQNEWAVAVLPQKGFTSINSEKTSIALTELESAARELKGGQYLIASGTGALPEIRVLPTTQIQVDQQFVVIGSGLEIIHARVERQGTSLPPRLVSFEIRRR